MNEPEQKEQKPVFSKKTGFCLDSGHGWKKARPLGFAPGPGCFVGNGNLMAVGRPHKA